MDLANWGKHELRNVRTIGFESWLLRLPLEKSSCANSRGVMSVLFNHACRYEFFDRNPIRLLRQGAKRKAAPNILTPDEIKTLMDGLATRERTLVLLAASTGLRQCELFGLKWLDVSFADRSINVTWSMVCGVVGPCKNRVVAKASSGSSAPDRNTSEMERTANLTIGFSQANGTVVENRSGVRRF